MYPYPDIPKPLNPTEFYLLLSLNHTPTYAYALKGMIYNLSLGSVQIPDSNLRRTINNLINQAFIDHVGKQPAGKSGNPRMYYSITDHGTLRLKEELLRLDHAVKIGRAAGLMKGQAPLDIQRLILDTRFET